MKNICIITTVHQPFDVRIFHKEAKSLVAAGYDVTLIAQHDKDEIIDGVRIIALPKSSSRLWRMTTTVWLAFRKALAIDADIYHFHDPELIPAGLKLKRLGKKVIFDIHEDTRQQIVLKKYIPMPLTLALSRVYALYEDYACRKFSALVTPQQRMTLHYGSLNTAVTVENYVDISLYPRREIDFGKPVLFHAGSLSEDRGLFNMVNAAKKISGDFLFYVAGKLDDSINVPSLSPLVYLGVLDQQSVMDMYSKSNIGIILYNNIGQYSMAGAIKCYEYMANSMPIIMPDFGEWNTFNDKCKCGINANVLDFESVALTVNYLIGNPDVAKQMGLNGRKWVEENCSWEIAFEKLDALYRKLLA